MRTILIGRAGVFAALLLLVVSLPACILVVDDDYDDDLHRTRWRLDVIVYYGRSYTVDGAYTLNFDSDHVLSGYADCNEYDGEYEISLLGALSVRDLYTTDVECRRSLEEYYFESLYNARSYRIQDGALTITGRGGDFVLYFYRD